MIEYFVELLASFLAVVIIITLHEFAHAFVAYKCGDPTAKFYGRMTLNPAKHFDPLGMLAFALVGFGWAKPVPINPYNFKDYKKGSFLTASAGIIINYVTAFFFYPLAILTLLYVVPNFTGTYMEYFLTMFVSCLFTYSLSFCVFNLLPFYPLDGFRIVDALNERRGRVYRFLRQYGYYILLGLMMISLLADRIPAFGAFDVLHYVMRFAVDIIGKPITACWNPILEAIL
ncbi:MAG: site-2 protease family protein [Clostridia bacterium]|nr:site-2 protease family protein [Clostridia bacterium]